MFKLTGIFGLVAGGCIIGGLISGAIIGDSQPLGHWTKTVVPHKTALQQTTTGQAFDIHALKTITGTLVSSPNNSFDWWRQVISTSTGHLDLWMYDITYNRAKLPLVKLAEAGLPIRIILEDNKYQSYGDSYVSTKALFEDVGMSVMSDEDLGLDTNFVHAKAFVTSAWALIQTANLTKAGFTSSREYYTSVTDAEVIANLQALFDSDRDSVSLDARQIHPNILVCPINCRAKIEALISGATSSIMIQNQYIEDPTLVQLLHTKKHLSMQLIAADNEFAPDMITKFSGQFKVLTSPYPHAKMMLIDDQYLLVSSINFSTNSIDRNREIGIIITNRDAIEYFKHTFTQDRAKGKSLFP